MRNTQTVLFGIHEEERLQRRPSLKLEDNIERSLKATDYAVWTGFKRPGIVSSDELL
jgi:hypothetical protein